MVSELCQSLALAQYELDWTTGRLGMHRKCVTKNVKILWKICKFDDFLKMTSDQPGSVPRPKKQHFNTKIDDF